MSRPLAALLPLLVALTLSLPAKSVARPPEEVSGKLVLDEVADGLMRYRLQKCDDKRIAWLKRLAPSCDPRVKAVLKEAANDGSPEVVLAALMLLLEHYSTVANVPPRMDIPPLAPPILGIPGLKVVPVAPRSGPPES